MKKLSYPKHTFNDVLDSCANGMKQRHVKQNFLKTKPIFIDIEKQYKLLGEAGSLFQLPRVDNVTKKEIVVPSLTKEKLLNLYKTNLRGKDKPARVFYNKMLLSTDERCPFCGDIGHSRNLDHFLPIAHYPRLSIMPVNLIPACRDCNMGEKGDIYAKVAEDQVLHPYLDDDKFFQEVWVHAQYIDEDDGALRYFVQPPNTWNNVDKTRVRKHFNDFDLARRYGVEAGKHLSELITLKENFYIEMKDLIPENKMTDAFVSVFLKPIINGELFSNHWKKVMYVTLSTSQEFLLT